MAARFKFRLDFLIKMRQRKEEEAMARLAKRLASIRDIENEIVSLNERKDRLAGELDEKMKSGGITVPLIILYKEYDGKLAKDIARANEFLRLSRREEAKERAALTKASIDRKIMEKLKENKKAEFAEEQAYLEQNNLEEMASLAKARRDREAARERAEEYQAGVDL
ncbi:flagellar export protein FliJ [Deltaproteobacteria bacterium Smac51]|nr:flagellar export protein FliJ [Deltaproteobacteria bacterium Smac51]